MSDYLKSGRWPPLVRDFITYHESIKNHSRKTCDEYLLDLRHFLRFCKRQRGLVGEDVPFDAIEIDDVDKAFLEKVSITEVYAFLNYLSRERLQQQNSPGSRVGLGAAARARKVSCLNSFFKYLTVKVHVLDENPIAGLDAPKAKKDLPKFLSVEQSGALLDSVTGTHKVRDTAIITVFLVCGLRISELVGLNMQDWQTDTLRVLGKGNKVRIVYLNDMAKAALSDYMAARKALAVVHTPALFVSGRGNRMHVQTVHKMVKKNLMLIGLSDYSSHKLRHSAATMMLNGGANIRVVQEVLGHEHLNTTEIYTHVISEDMRRAATLHPLQRKRGFDGSNQEETE